MTHQINHDGLSRLVHLELSRMAISNPLDAQRVLTGMIGVYDSDGSFIAREVGNFYANTAACTETTCH